MAKLLAVLFLSTVLASCSAWPFLHQDGNATTDWTDLSAKFGHSIFTSFKSLPRTVDDAVDNDWAPLGEDDCTANELFYGRRYAYKEDPTICLLYDKNGVVAGIQAGFRKAELEVEGNDYQYSTSEFFKLDTINGEEFYYITTYFVDPATICSQGRAQSAFQNEGTGFGIFAQKGNRDTNVHVTKEEQSLSGTQFTPENCFIAMGHHYFSSFAVDMDCTTIRPHFILTREHKVVGFGLVVIGHATGATYFGGYEHPPMLAVRQIVKNVPDCLQSYADNFDLTSLHVYFVEHPAMYACMDGY